MKWVHAPQIGGKGHCFQAQVFNDDEYGKSVAIIESTEDPAEATEIAKLMADAPNLKRKVAELEKLIDSIRLKHELRNNWQSVETLNMIKEYYDKN